MRSFITSVADGAKVKAGQRHAAQGHRLRRRQRHQGGRGLDRRRQDLDATATLGQDLGKYSFREWQLPVTLAAGTHELKVRAPCNRIGQIAADRRRCGTRRATCATSSKPSASRRPEGIDHDANPIFWPSRHSPSLTLAWPGSSASPSTPSRSPTSFPTETAALKPGPNLELVQGNCSGCHSADYIQTQPRGPQFKKDFWQAEVTKMIKVYGAPIDERDVPQDRRLSRSDILNGRPALVRLTS